MDVGIIGGRFAGLAAAEQLATYADEVTIYERDERIGEPVLCGEGVTSPHLIPVQKTPENGFVNECPNFVVRVQPAIEYGWSGERLAEVRLDCDPAFITDRGEVERAWSYRLHSKGVEIKTGHAVRHDAFEALRATHDVVIDASGNPSLTMKYHGLGAAYGEDMVALNADVRGDFSAFYPEAWVIFEGTRGYFWVFPKSEHRANVGIGWTTGFAREHSLDYIDELVTACARHDVPAPNPSDVSVSTIPSGPALAKEHLYWPGADEADVYLVGDAAGIANRYQGEGISQSITSSEFAAAAIKHGQGDRYPDLLWGRMLPEFRLAHLMKSLWDDYEDPALIASVTRAIEGLTLEEVTREPRQVYRRIARHPRLALRIARNPAIYRRLWTGYTDGWTYGRG